MDRETKPNIRQWLPTILAVLVVLAGTITNLFLIEQDAGLKTISNGFEKVRGDMGFAKWSTEHQMANIEPNALFAIVNGKIVGQFHFRSKSYRTLQSAGVSDHAQRPWINVDHSDGTYHVNYYPKGDGDMLTEPTLTFVDTDGDGLTDRKIDWLGKRTYDATDPLAWSLLEKVPKPSVP